MREDDENEEKSGCCSANTPQNSENSFEYVDNRLAALTTARGSPTRPRKYHTSTNTTTSSAQR